MRDRRKTVAAALGILSILGCTLPFGQQTEDEAEEPTAAANPQAARIELEREKGNVYVGDCFNRVRTLMDRPIGNYRNFLRWTNELTTQPSGSPASLHPRIEPSWCRAAVNRAATMPPSMPDLERSAEAFAAAIEALVPLLLEADQYYQRGSFRDDQLARGREMHPRLMRAMDAYIAARNAFDAQLQDVEERRMRARLDELERDRTRRGSYLVEYTQYRGRQLADMAQALITAFAETGSIPEADRSAYVAAVTGFEQEVAALQQHRAAPGEVLPRGFTSYQGQSEQMLRGQLRFMRYVRDTNAPTLEALQSHFEHTIRGFNAAVNAYNNVRFPE